MKVIGICGNIGAGKDTAAGILVRDYGYERAAFADLLRCTTSYVYKVPIEWCYSQEDKRTVLDGVDSMAPKVLRPDGTPHTVRSLLECVGQALRGVCPDTWIIAAGLAEHERVVVPDVRYANEFDAIRALGGEVWEVRMEGGPPAERTGHDSDEEWRPLSKERALVNVHGDFGALEDCIAHAMEGLGKEE